MKQIHWAASHCSVAEAQPRSSCVSVDDRLGHASLPFKELIRIAIVCNKARNCRRVIYPKLSSQSFLCKRFNNYRVCPAGIWNEKVFAFIKGPRAESGS